MALTKFSGAADVISQLSNQPNDNEGLSAAQLKACFDAFGAAFKTFFNNTHVPEVEAALDSAAAGIGTTQKLNGSAITDGTITADKLSTSSGFEAVSTAVIRDEAVTESKLSTDVQTVLDSVEYKTTHLTKYAVLASDAWTDNQQTVTVQGVTSSNVVITTAASDDTSHTAWSNNDIRAVSQGSNSLTFKCRTAPASAVNVNILILN